MASAPTLLTHTVTAAIYRSAELGWRRLEPGGGKLQMAFMKRGAPDDIEIYVISEIIGGGLPLFPPTGLGASPKLISAQSFGQACARLHYRFG